MDEDVQAVRRIGGAVDDVVITGDTFHLERMEDDAWWAGIYRGDRCVSLWIACEAGRIDVEVTNDELGCIDDTDQPPAAPEAGERSEAPADRAGLRAGLADWTDWDIATFALACALGVMGEGVRFHLEAKHLFWTDHPIGTMLHEMLQRLVEVGVLQQRDEPDDQYRWNPGFRGSWEPA